jgi:DNA-binding transcriptional ArsR family regulator
MAAGECSPVLKALADQTRQRIVKVLLERDLSVNELTDALSLSQYNTSKHLSVLKSAGIVDVRAVGPRREYFIAPTLRKRMRREGLTLDFGCCTFRVDQLSG